MSALIEHYEHVMKQYVMHALTGHQQVDLKSYLHELIAQHASDYKAINYAYLNVKKEIIG